MYINIFMQYTCLVYILTFDKVNAVEFKGKGNENLGRLFFHHQNTQLVKGITKGITWKRRGWVEILSSCVYKCAHISLTTFTLNEQSCIHQWIVRVQTDSHAHTCFWQQYIENIEFITKSKTLQSMKCRRFLHWNKVQLITNMGAVLVFVVLTV